MATLRKVGAPAPAIRYAPAESIANDTQALGQFGPTSGGEDLSGSTINIQQDGHNLLSQLGIVGAVIELVIDLLVALGNWIADEFQGVPEQAKTIGTGVQLSHQKDPISGWLGLNLAAGGAAGSVLSDGNWPHNLAGRFIANGGAMIEWANQPPPSSYWQVRPTKQPWLNRGAPSSEYRIGPVPPPSGAPYDNPVIIDGLFAPQPMDPAAYQQLWGVQPPTPDQMVLFLDQMKGVNYQGQLADNSTLEAMRESYRTLWFAAWKDWLTAHPQPTPGQGPPPPSDEGCADPCSIEAISQLYSIALQLNAMNTPLMALIPGIPRLIAAITSLSNHDVSDAILEAANASIPYLDAIRASIDKAGAGSSSSSSADLKRIADQLAGYQASYNQAQQLQSLILNDGAFDPRGKAVLSAGIQGP